MLWNISYDNIPHTALILPHYGSDPISIFFTPNPLHTNIFFGNTPHTA